MQRVIVMPASVGWSVSTASLDSELIFKSGARAEAGAKRLATALAASGEAVEVEIHLRDGSVGGRFVCYPEMPA